MKFYSSLSVIMMVTWGVFGTTWANLQFGSRESGFIVSSGATLNLGTATLIDGMIRQSGDISASALTCTSVTIEVKDGTDIKKITTDGTLTPTSNLQLGNNQKLTVAGGSVHEALNITGGSSTPSILEGFGWLASDIKINPASQLNLRWSSPLGVNINFHFTSNDQSSSVALEQDFYLAFGSGFYATYATGGLTNVIGILSFDRGSLFIGGESTSYASVAGNMQWVMPSVILTGPLSIDEATTVALSSGGHINGYGYTLNFTDETSVLAIDDDSTICLVDIILTGLTSTSLANTYVAADGVWFCTNTTLQNSNNSITLDGSMTGAAIDVFGSGGVTFGASTIALNGDVALQGTWSFTDNAVIEGNGHHLDLSAGTLSVANTKTLRLHNVILKNVKTASLGDTTTGTVSLAGVTMFLYAADVEWGAYDTCLTVDGPLYVVTGSHTLTVPYSAGTSVLNGVTAYYDTLSTANAGNLVGFTGTGRVLFVESSVFGNVTIAANVDLGSDEYLCPDDDGISGHTITFDASGTVEYDGHGHTLFFPHTSSSMDGQTVFTIVSGTVVKTFNIVFEGLKPAHLSLPAVDALRFSDQTTVRLHEDWIGVDNLTTALTFGQATGATNESVELDLNGRTIDMSDEAALIKLIGSTGSRLSIKNGRLINLADDPGTGPKLIVPAGCTLCLSNVELSLNGNFTFANAALEIQGNCIISGVPGAVLNNTSTASLSIASAARLMLMDGLVYSHNNAGTANFSMSDGSSCLELIGATFRRPDVGSGGPLVLADGTLIIDHKSYFQPGAQGIDFDGLTVEIRPAATIHVGTGTGASAGTLDIA